MLESPTHGESAPKPRWEGREAPPPSHRSLRCPPASRQSSPVGLVSRAGTSEAERDRGGARHASLVFRSALFTAGQVLLTLLFSPVAVAALVLPYRSRYRIVMQWTSLNIWWLGVTCGLRHRVEGLENIPKQATIVLCKHQSTWETLVLPRYFSPQTWVLKRELLRIPFFGWGLATLRPIAIDRAAGRDALEQVLEQGRRRLAEGIWVVVFPEGTRVAPGKRRRYRLGGAVLAEKTGRAVVPVAHNAGDYWPRRGFLKRPGTIRLVIGKPIQSEGLGATEINARAGRWIESTVRELREGARHSPDRSAEQGHLRSDCRGGAASRSRDRGIGTEGS